MPDVTYSPYHQSMGLPDQLAIDTCLPYSLLVIKGLFCTQVIFDLSIEFYGQVFGKFITNSKYFYQINILTFYLTIQSVVYPSIRPSNQSSIHPSDHPISCLSIHQTIHFFCSFVITLFHAFFSFSACEMPSLIGSLDGVCDSYGGSYICKSNYTGSLCNQCSNGFYNYTNDMGCQSMFY